MSLRAAVIGCGRIGAANASDPRMKGVSTHAAAYAGCAETRLVGVCDTDAARSRRCAERWATAAYTDVDRLLVEQRPHLVSVCTPDETHFDILSRVMASDDTRAVIAEKPLAHDLEHSACIARLARTRNIVLAVNYKRRYSPGHASVRDRVRAGAIGALQTVSGAYTKGVIHNATHWFDLLQWVAGPIVEVQGFMPSHRIVDSTDPTIDIRLTLASGASAYLHACNAESFTIFEMDLIGEAGRIRIVDSGHTIQTFTIAESANYSGHREPWLSGQHDGGLDSTLRSTVEDVVDCVNSGGNPRCSGDDGVAAVRIAMAAISSARSGLPMAIASNEQ